MGAKRGIAVTALAAIFLAVPVSASAAPQFSAITIQETGEVDASISTNELDLGDVVVDTTKTATVTLTSTGTSPVIMGGSPEIKLEDGTFPRVPAFSASQPESCNGMAASQSCAIEVSFTPRSPLPYHHQLWLYGNFGNFKIDLYGSGIDSPEFETPRNVRFGEKLVGSKSTRTVSLSTTSFSPASLSRARIAGPGASFFTLTHDPGSCQNVNFGASCDFNLTYRPTATGSHKADLKLSGNFGTRTIKLSGSARRLTAPKLAIRAFGPFRAGPGEIVTFTTRIYNRGEKTARNVTLETSVPQSLAAKVKSIRIKSIAPSKQVAKSIRIRVLRGARKGSWMKIRFIVSAKSAISGSTRRAVRIR